MFYRFKLCTNSVWVSGWARAEDGVVQDASKPFAFSIGKHIEVLLDWLERKGYRVAVSENPGTTETNIV